MTTDRLVLGLHPTPRGFGWILFEKPLSPLDWGIVERRTDRNTRCLFAFQQILDRYKPDVVALEDYDVPQPPRVSRVRRLCRNIESLASGRNIDVCVYSRSEIRGVFAELKPASRDKIARAIAERVEVLRPRLPRQRAAWDKEHPKMALFNAAAVALAHYTLDPERP